MLSPDEFVFMMASPYPDFTIWLKMWVLMGAFSWQLALRFDGTTMLILVGTPNGPTRWI